MRAALAPLPRFIITAAVAKHRTFIWMHSAVLPDQATLATARADDTTFGILHSRFHQLWSLRMGTSLEDRPRYTPTTCFETFPFPAGLTPADTAHQRVEILPDGAVIPGNWGQSAISPETMQSGFMDTGSWPGMTAKLDSDPKFPRAAHMSNVPLAPVDKAYAATNSEANHVCHCGPDPQSMQSGFMDTGSWPGMTAHSFTLTPLASRNQAIAIAQAAKCLNDLRENWLNPPEWTHKVPEVTPLGLDISPYPDRIEPKPGISETDFKALQKRTLTNLYNAKPAWLTMAHQQLDQAVASAYGWADYRADMPDDEILQRLLALNLARSVSSQNNVSHAPYHPTTL